MFLAITSMYREKVQKGDNSKLNCHQVAAIKMTADFPGTAESFHFTNTQVSKHILTIRCNEKRIINQ